MQRIGWPVPTADPIARWDRPFENLLFTLVFTRKNSDNCYSWLTHKVVGSTVKDYLGNQTLHFPLSAPTRCLLLRHYLTSACLYLQAERGSHGLPGEDDRQVFGERTVQAVQSHRRLEGPAGLGENSNITHLHLCHIHSLTWGTFSFHSPVLIISQVNTFGANNPLTNLVPSLQDVSPDDAFSSVPYEKGFALLYYLEEQLGGPGNTCTLLHTHLFPVQLLTHLLICFAQRCSWALWSRTSSGLPTAASPQRSGKTTCLPTSRTRWGTTGHSGRVTVTGGKEHQLGRFWSEVRLLQEKTNIYRVIRQKFQMW